MVTAPMDWTSCRSNTGLKVVAPLIDFQTPPLAEPANTVIFPFSSTASMAAEPIFRALRPEMVPESNFTALCWATALVRARRLRAKIRVCMDGWRRAKVFMRLVLSYATTNYFAPVLTGAGAGAEGILKLL